MKHAVTVSLALTLCLAGFGLGYGNETGMRTTPTTKILAIGTINPGVEQAQVFAILPEEVKDTVNLYLDGKIDQWYSLQGRPGVAFILNVTDTAAAHEMLEKLPLGQAHLMSFERSRSGRSIRFVGCGEWKHHRSVSASRIIVHYGKRFQSPQKE